MYNLMLAAARIAVALLYAVTNHAIPLLAQDRRLAVEDVLLFQWTSVVVPPDVVT
jgi:hypothetical protein